MKWVISLLFLTSTALGQSSNHERLSQIKELHRFAFGSCNKTNREQPLWKDLTQMRPQLFIWGGDNVYADSGKPGVIREEYEKQNKVADYKLFKAVTPIIGIWDDHDFGKNNGGGNFPIREESRQLALDFLEEPKDSPRRKQEGLQTSYVFGQGKKKAKFILLDNRYFKDLEPNAPLLGMKQWQWLEAELTSSDASLHFIVSGLSILSRPNPASEEWIDYPSEFARLQDIIKRTNPKGLILLTGDKHFSSVMERHGLIEFMSSGMTHNTEGYLRPWVRARYPEPLFKKNYGMVEIDWDEEFPQVTIYFRTSEGETRNLKRFRWSPTGWQKEVGQPLPIAQR